MASLYSRQSDSGVASHRKERSKTQFARRRSQVAFIREENEVCAMNGLRRFQAKAFNLIRRILFCYRGDAVYNNTKKLDNGKSSANDNNNDGDVDDERGSVELGNARKQYRLKTKAGEVKISLKKRWLSILTCGCIGSSSEFGLSSGQQWISSWMHWIFRVHLLFAFLCMCLVFFTIAVAFAGLIVAAGLLDKQCIRVGSYDFGTFGSRFYDAFYLSWTTLGTVGYGSVYPSASNQNNDASRCAFIAALSSFEVLIGTLYSGFCGAVLFAKVLNIRNLAMVAFSDPIVIRYGSGVEDFHLLFDHEHLLDNITKKSPTHNHHHDDNDHHSDHVDGDSNEEKALPCPVLEFRIANLVWDKPNGVYIDARLNVVANVDANDVDPSLRAALDPETRWKQAMSAVMHPLRLHPLRQNSSSQSETVVTESTDNSDIVSQTTTTSDSMQQSNLLDSTHSSNFYEMYASIHGGSNESDHHDHHHWGLPHMPRFFHRQSSGSSHDQPYHPHQDHRAVDEDPTSTLVTKRIFSKMHLEATDHPYFKRVWLARHILNDHSPLLTPRVRRLIRRHGGHWPEELNNAGAVRSSLKFNQIVVSFQGVCNATATTVYAQKIYHFSDVNIGYQFVDMLVEDDDGSVEVDIDKINLVREQNGGGGEPLLLHEQDSL